MTEAASVTFWDGIAESYARKPWPDPQATARRLAITRSLLAPHHHLLDLGCGTGTILLELAPLVARAEGFDLSPAMIRIAEGKAAGAANVRFEARSACPLPHADGAVDVVLAYNLLHLVDDPLAVLREVRRVLRPGGAFVANTACLGESWWPPYGLILPVMRWLGKAPPVLRFSEATLRAWYVEAGFAEIVAPEGCGSADGPFLVARAPG